MRGEEGFSPRVCASRFPAITIYPSSHPESARHLRIATTRLFRWIMVIALFANIIVDSSLDDDDDGEGRAQHLKPRGKTSGTRVRASRRNENKAKEDRWRIDIADETPCLTLRLHCRRAWSIIYSNLLQCFHAVTLRCDAQCDFLRERKAWKRFTRCQIAYANCKCRSKS